MSRRRKQRMMRIGSGLVPLGSAAYSADYNARLRAAGLEDDDAEWDARDIDDRRLRLARQITMYSNEWTGCPEAICQRMRGCMAPRVHCTNVPQPSEAELDAAWPQTLVIWRRALAEAEARQERERAKREAAGEMQGKGR